MMQIFIGNILDLCRSDFFCLGYDSEKETPIAGFHLIGIECLSLTKIFLHDIVIGRDTPFFIATKLILRNRSALYLAQLIEDDLRCRIRKHGLERNIDREVAVIAGRVNGRSVRKIALRTNFVEEALIHFLEQNTLGPPILILHAGRRCTHIDVRRRKIGWLRDEQKLIRYRRNMLDFWPTEVTLRK